MTYDQYWDGEPEMMIAYAKAYVNQQKEDWIRRDTDAWLEGQYVYTAVGTVMANAFSKIGSKKVEYPNKPLFGDVFDEEAKERKQKAELERLEMGFLFAAKRSIK